MIKRTINLLVTLALYELGKHLTEQLIIILTANDDVDAFNEYDHIDSNDIRAEVSG
ncbi:transcriptional activator RinB [Staphylococcus pseudintermedius]|uniref:transcriptional activator RinB n=1 Tax=Staphylococcus pseudintermedius TaxID=283734 RepID=UPI00220EF5B4|nr:transcriptional regulator [Staphylococcus pseudintermedius]EKC6413277.1 transcriptional regulator [Staphylococcus pseudintermedius]UVT35148.1 transcriptional regulator [Staphylococcus phage vB_SpsS_VL4]